jgi:hypothetical protein
LRQPHQILQAAEGGFRRQGLWRGVVAVRARRLNALDPISSVGLLRRHGVADALHQLQVQQAVPSRLVALGPPMKPPTAKLTLGGGFQPGTVAG